MYALLCVCFDWITAGLLYAYQMPLCPLPESHQYLQFSRSFQHLACVCVCTCVSIHRIIMDSILIILVWRQREREGEIEWRTFDIVFAYHADELENTFSSSNRNAYQKHYNFLFSTCKYFLITINYHISLLLESINVVFVLVRLECAKQAQQLFMVLVSNF